MAEKLRLRLRYAAVKVQMGCEDVPFEGMERIVDAGLVFRENSPSEYSEEYSSSSLMGPSPDCDGDSYSRDSPGFSASTEAEEYCDPRPLMGLLESDDSRETSSICDYSEMGLTMDSETGLFHTKSGDSGVPVTEYMFEYTTQTWFERTGLLLDGKDIS